MSLLKRGARRPIAKVGLTVFALAAFQVAAVIGAGVASAVTGCTFNPATNTINITIDPGETAGVAVENATADLDPESPPGAILFDNNGAGFDNGALSTQCGSATNTLTASIVVLGSPSSDEVFYIENGFGFGGSPINTAITWAVDLGSNTVGGFDIFLLFGSDGDDTVVLTDTTFTNNGGGGPLLGVEIDEVLAGDGDDTIDGSAMSAALLIATGDADDDWIAGGACCVNPVPITNETLVGGAGTDTISYATRTTPTVIDNTTSSAGHDANGDCDVVDVGDEFDVEVGFEIKQTGSGADCLVGVGGVAETFIPGDGDDDITGQTGEDTIDWSSSSAGMVIDPANDTATGQGTDDIDGINMFIGSPFDDTLIFDGSTAAFDGGAGIDLVDGSLTTTGVVIDLDTLDGAPVGGVGAPPDSLENALGGSGNDALVGNDLNNNLSSGDGDDVLTGAGGNDFLQGGNGNDTYSGGLGADTVSFQASAAGVDVDLSLGFATGEGSDALLLDVEIVKGSAHDDNITGGELGFGGSINFRFIGAAGDDVITGSTSNDTLKGGAGDDVERAGEGDDTLAGAGGDDLLVGGAGFDIGKGGKGDDVCKGVESKKSCGTQKNPAKVQLKSLTAKLV